MNINKDILAFYWLRFVMWFYFIFHGMTTKSSKEVIIYHVILHWPVDIDRLKKLKWWPINPVSIEIWDSIQLLHFIEYFSQLCRGGQLYWWRKPEDPEKTTDLSQVHLGQTGHLECQVSRSSYPGNDFFESY